MQHENVSSSFLVVADEYCTVTVSMATGSYTFSMSPSSSFADLEVGLTDHLDNLGLHRANSEYVFAFTFAVEGDFECSPVDRSCSLGSMGALLGQKDFTVYASAQEKDTSMDLLRDQVSAAVGKDAGKSDLYRCVLCRSYFGSSSLVNPEVLVCRSCLQG